MALAPQQEHIHLPAVFIVTILLMFLLRPWPHERARLCTCRFWDVLELKASFNQPLCKMVKHSSCVRTDVSKDSKDFFCALIS